MRNYSAYISSGIKGLASVRKNDTYRLLVKEDLVYQKTKYGFSVFVDINDPYIGRTIIFRKDFEPEVSREFKKQLKDDSVVIDVGANCGWFSLLTLAHNDNTSVIAIDPDVDVLNRLKAAALLQMYDSRLTTVNKAASDDSKALFVSDLGQVDNSGARFVGSKALLRRLGTGDETMSKIDSIAIDDLDAKKVDILKIDTEGYEPYVLRSAKKTIAAHRPDIFMEFFPGNIKNIGNTDPRQFAKDIFVLGYKVYVLRSEGPLSVVRSEDLFEHFTNGIAKIDLYLSDKRA